MSKASTPLRTGFVIVACTVTVVPTTAATSPPSVMCSAGTPVYAGYRRSIASVLSAGRSVIDSTYVGERMPFASTKYSVACVRSNTREVNVPASESRDIGRRTQSDAESERNTSSAPSVAKPTSAAFTSTAAPRGMAAFPGSTRTASVGVAASATDHGAKSCRAVWRNCFGPIANSSAAETLMMPSERIARRTRGRSIASSRCRGRTTASVRSRRRAVNEGDARSVSGTFSSCTAESSACRSSGACSST